MTDLTLAQRVLAIEGALADVPHAFGGALALAYYAEPRATVDIDLNVFVPPERFREVAVPLDRLGAEANNPSVATLVQRDGQARVDIEAVVAGDAEIDVAEVLRWVARIAGDEDPRYNRIVAVLSRR
jgi:hypothetical protein